MLPVEISSRTTGNARKKDPPYCNMFGYIYKYVTTLPAPPHTVTSLFLLEPRRVCRLSHSNCTLAYLMRHLCRTFVKA